jgi:hypothetical protein
MDCFQVVDALALDWFGGGLVVSKRPRLLVVSPVPARSAGHEVIFLFANLFVGISALAAGWLAPLPERIFGRFLTPRTPEGRFRPVPIPPRSPMMAEEPIGNPGFLFLLAILNSRGPARVDKQIQLRRPAAEISAARLLN